MITGRPDHEFRPAWTDSKNRGHDCAGCPETSIFRCDELAHPSHNRTEFTRP